MTLVNVIKAIANCLKSTRKWADQCERKVDYIQAEHSMSCSRRREDNFLSHMLCAARGHVNNPELGEAITVDMADQSFKKMVMIESVFEKNKNLSLCKVKNEFFVFDFEKLERPALFDSSAQESADTKYNSYLSRRRSKISEIKKEINNSSLLAKIFCVYLARSNYPKINAFEMLPNELESLFDTERKNAKHLEKIKFLDSIL